MSTCPDKDIHSIYLDHELPAEFIGEYEKHIRECSKCRSQLEKMRRIHELFQLDSNAIMPDNYAIEQSFKRLESRLNYRKITTEKHIHIFSAVKWSIPAAAAAAVLAIMIPVRIRSVYKPIPPASSIFAISRQKPVPITQNKVVVSGNIPHNALMSLFKHNLDSEKGNILTAQDTSFGFPFETEEKNVSAALTSIDIFRPEFSDKDTVTIHIIIPHMGTIPFVSEIQVPLSRLENKKR